MAQRSDEDLLSCAAKSLQTMEIPSERRAIVEREWFCLRDIAREKFAWCRHLNIVQNLRHTQSRQTLYARDPERRCICEKFQYKSKIGATDWDVLITTFKNAYCMECTAREPKLSRPTRPDNRSS